MSGVIKINTNGVTDTSFNGDFNSSWWGVHALAQLPTSNSLLVGGNFNDYKGTIVANMIKIHSTSGAMQPCASTPTSVALIISFALFTPGIGSLTVSIDNVPTVYTNNTPYTEIIVAKGSSISVQVKGIGSSGALATKSLLIDENNVGNRYTETSSVNISTPPIIINNVTNIQAEVS